MPRLQCIAHSPVTGEFSIPLKREVRYGAPTLRFLNCNYIYANLPLCEMTAQEKDRKSSRPPQADVFQAAGSLLLLLKRKRRRFFLKRRILKKMIMLGEWPSPYCKWALCGDPKA